MKLSENRHTAVWMRDRVICRLFAAWCWFAVYMLTREGEFTSLSFGQDYTLAVVGLWTLANFILLTPIAVLCHPYNSDSWFLMGGATVCVWLWLYQLPANSNRYLIWLAVAVVYALFVLYFLSANEGLFRKWSPNRRVVTVVAVTGALVSCFVISVITCLRYKTFSSPNFDFGLFVNMFHNMRETGEPLVTSERDRLLSHFAVHISPIYYLLLPFYWLIPSPLTLQVGQAVALMLGIIPVLLLAKHFKLSPWATLGVSLLYAFYPALSTGCFYDIHENCFLPLFLLLTFYFFETERTIPMFLSAICVLGVKEDAAIYLIIFALYAILSRKKYLRGGALLLLAAWWFYEAGELLEKYGLGMMVNRFDNLIYDREDGLLGAIKTALVNPGYLLTQLFTTGKTTWEKIAYFCQMLLPLGLLPFCSKKASRWLLAAPLLINLLTYYQYQYDIGFQYHFGIAAFLIYAVIVNLPELSPNWRRSLLGAGLAFCFSLYLVSVVPTFNSYVTRWEDGKETYLRMEEILDTVPEDASVNCSTFLLAHIADRNEIYEIGYHDNKPDVDYVVIDARYSDWKQKANAYLTQGYEITFSEPGKIVILQKQT
ncbi:MAG: DUF2079 domain-containing protein [Ruminococcaceae bacterium]|nr:DUF2079 domain-containing protein [Oscillospiraceae bacterium]